MPPEISYAPVNDSATNLAALRRAVQALEAGAGTPAGRISLGDQRLDQALPGRGLAGGAMHEAAPAAHFDGPAAYAFLLGCAARALAARPGALIWVRRRGACGFGGAYGPGLAGFGIDPARVLFVATRRAEETLWAAEEAARAAGIGAVVVEIGPALDLTAARRLQLAAEAGGAPLLAWRPAQAAPAGPARTRWRIAAAPSAPDAWGGFGPPVWRVGLERARGGTSASFLLEWRYETHSFRVAAVLGDGSSSSARGRAAA